MTLQIPLLRREREDEPSDVLAPPVPEVTQENPAEPRSAAPLASPEEERPGVLAEFALDIAHAIRAARRSLRDLTSREGNWVTAFLAAKPRSVDEQRGYLANRRWLPPGHEGGIADRAGEAYQAAIGIPGVAFGNAVSLTCKHAFRFTVATFVILVALFAGCRFVLHLPPATCVAVPGLLAAILAGYVAAVALLLAARRAFARWRAER
jgi:hypothetical protein